jgi:predicted phage-related endonuclease
MAKTKTGHGAGRANYMAQLIVERLTSRPMETYSNAAMQRGIEMEPLAIEAYEIATGDLVEPSGFVRHPWAQLQSGASPDGLVGLEGLIEVKCPNTATHIETLLTEAIDSRYQLQMQWQMVSTNRQWCDFVSYDDRMPPAMQLWVRRVERDNTLIAQIEREVDVFVSDMLERLDALRGRYR